MARIVMVHGAFHELWGPHQLKDRWLPALQDGLWRHGLSVDPDDVAVCFYGDLFRHDAEKVDPDEWEAAREGAAEMLDEVGGEEALGFLSQAAGTAAYERTIDMVTVMNEDPDIRDKTRARFLEAVGTDTDVIVAHSLGTVISHQALAANPGIEIDMLITLGSPLGSSMVFPALEPPPADGVGQWPGGARNWVNVAAVGDKAASVSRLAEKFGPRVEDHLVDNGYRAHNPEPYLNNAKTGAAVARGLGLLD